MEDRLVPAIASADVLTLCRRLKKLIDHIVPLEFKESAISRSDSVILTDKVYRLTLDAATITSDGEQRDCKGALVYALLTVRKWYSLNEDNLLSDADLYSIRGLACEHLVRKVIEKEQDEYFLFQTMLCQRYSLPLKAGAGRDRQSDQNLGHTWPTSAVELAADLHATVVMSSSGFERCINWMWRGWIVQSATDSCAYEFYRDLDKRSLWTHFDPDRIRTPQYQSSLQLIFTLAYLGLYTWTINSLSTDEERGLAQKVDLPEALLYLFTISYVWDEFVKVYDVGMAYIGFWNGFNDTLYALVLVSFGFRLAGFNTDAHHYYVTAYHVLACTAPFFWGRLLLHLDSVRFFGAMLVVVQVMMRESMIFFVLLLVIAAGFLQAFIGLDEADGVLDVTRVITLTMGKTVLSSPEFDVFDKFAPPYGALLYYIFTFLISTILLNILVALFNSAYEKIYDNATDEFLALKSQKTLRFVRAPDDYVFVPPLNLLELFGLILPLRWWMDHDAYKRLNVAVMKVVYAPALLAIAYYETRVAATVQRLRQRGNLDDSAEGSDDVLDQLIDDDRDHVQPQADSLTDLQEKKWLDKVKQVAPKVDMAEQLGVSWENYELVRRIEQLTDKVDALLEARAS